MWLSCCVLIYSLFEFVADMSRGSASNGRWVSFLQSVESAYAYRIQEPHRSKDMVAALSPRSKIKKGLSRDTVYYAGSNTTYRGSVYLGFVCGWLKFGTGTVISFALGVEPVLGKNWRHFASFGVALMCVQLTPKDIFYQYLAEKSASGLLLR